jgi:hypothetical protein
MISAAITCFLIGASLIAIASLMDSACRLPGYLRHLEAERQRLENVTHYTGPAYSRHGRQIEGN